MALESCDDLKKKLARVDIKYTNHFEEDVNPERDNIGKELIEKHLRNPESLLKSEYQEDQHHREKYDLYFDKSSKYALRIVVSFSKDYKNLYIVTFHVINKKRLDLAQKY